MKPKQPTKQTSQNWLYGFHAARAAWLNPARTIKRLVATEAALADFSDALLTAKGEKLTRPNPEVVERRELDQLLPQGTVHQGIAVLAGGLEEVGLEDVLRAASLLEQAVIVVLDQVTDPHNVGAIARSAAAFGALAVILPERNAPPLSGVVAKTASGALDVLPLVRVNNLARAMAEMKEPGFWLLGFAESGGEVLGEADLKGKMALVMGAEGEGMRRLTMENCDRLLRLPTHPPIGSLNVSNAAAVALFEWARQNSSLG
jgi:23S rRNA (guanosine2251-2'-O)-methyltransferase